MAYLYLITNTLNGKQYVGATITPISSRWNRHKSDAKKFRNGMALHSAIRKYGSENFTIDLLHLHPDANFVFNVLEPCFIALYETYGDNHGLGGYNMTRGGDGWLGKKHTLESKTKMRLVKLGKVASDEAKRNMSASRLNRKAWNTGKKCPQLGTSKKGVPLSISHKENIKSALEKTSKTEESKRKIQDSLAERWILNNPSGETIEVCNLRAFCKQNSISQGNLATYGKSKGYVVVKRFKKLRKYVVLDENTQILYESENLSALCEHLGISNAGLLNKYKQNKSYCGYRITSLEITEKEETLS